MNKLVKDYDQVSWLLLWLSWTTYEKGPVMLTLSFPHHGSILLLIMGKTLNKSIHVKSEQLVVGLLLLRRPPKVLAVRVQHARQATDKRCPDSVGVESVGAHQRNVTKTATV